MSDLRFLVAPLVSLLVCAGCGSSDDGGSVTPPVDTGTSGDSAGDGGVDSATPPPDGSPDGLPDGVTPADGSPDDSVDSSTPDAPPDTPPDGPMLDAPKPDGIVPPIDSGKPDGASGTCPPSTPTVGTPCAPDGLKCPYGSFTVCYCTSGKWMCAV